MRSISLQDLCLSSEESKEIDELVAQKRGIKNYESMSNDKLLSALISSITARKGKKPKFSKARIEEVEKEFKKSKHKLSKPIRDEIGRKNRKQEN